MGFYFVAAGFTISGALTMLIFRGALASLGPAVIAQSTQDTNGPLQLFAKMQAWRDFGAACGPLITGALLAYASPESLHAAVGVAMTVMFIFWVKGSLSLDKKIKINELIDCVLSPGSRQSVVPWNYENLICHNPKSLEFHSLIFFIFRSR